MPYSIQEESKLIHIQERIEQLLSLLKEHLREAPPNQIMHIKRELNQLIVDKLAEIKGK